MKTVVIVALALLIVAAIAGFVLYGNYQLPSPQPLPSISGNVIEITSSGFSPSVLTINKSDTVTFVNRDTAEHWTASANHPMHTVYPGSGIEKCGTAEQPQIFDACKGLSQGETFSFKFDNVGTWKYHDHLNPSSTGTIIVQEKPEQPPAQQYSVEVTGYPTSVNAGAVFYINWKVNSVSQISIPHTAVHYGPGHVPDPKGPQDYPNASSFLSGTIPGAFSADLKIDKAGTYYFRAHAIINGANFWSDEKAITVKAVSPQPAPAPSVSYSLEADDSGFYFANGTSVSSISAPANSSMTLTLKTRVQNVYYGGLDYRSQKFNSPSVAPGGNWTSPSVMVDGDFSIVSYWPSSGVSKAILNIVAV